MRQGLTADYLGLPQEVFDLFKDSVIVGRIGNYFTLKSVKRTRMVGRRVEVLEERKYIQIHSQPVQIGAVKDLGLNSLLNLIEDQFEYQGLVDGKHRFVRFRKEFTPEQMAIFNASAGNALTYDPEQVVEIEDTPEGETLLHHYGEEVYLRRAIKNRETGVWTWENLLTKEEALTLPVVPPNIRVLTFSQLERYRNRTLTSEQFDALCFEERKLVDIDLETDVANVFTETYSKGEGTLGLEVYFNGKTPDEKPLSEYTATPTGWWSRGYRVEWRLFNETPLPEVLNDGVLDMRDTAAAMSEIGNFGMTARVFFNTDDPNAHEINYRAIEGGEVPHYNPETRTFVYDPSKKCIIQGSIRILPIVGGKEATHESHFDVIAGQSKHRAF